ncbi:putative phosphatidylglycerophosphatase mitochondrial, partial [Bienertia sinuspersici]
MAYSFPQVSQPHIPQLSSHQLTAQNTSLIQPKSISKSKPKSISIYPTITLIRERKKTSSQLPKKAFNFSAAFQQICGGQNFELLLANDSILRASFFHRKSSQKILICFFPTSKSLIFATLTGKNFIIKVFEEENVAVFNNSVGLYEYDPEDSKAEALERLIGIRVKKPGGSSEGIEKQLGCKSMEIVMVGDRFFTDIVYGNKNESWKNLWLGIGLGE